MEKIDEDKTDYFVTRTSLTDVIATTEYFEAVENALDTRNEDSTFFEIDINGGLYKHICPVYIDEMIKILTTIKEDGCNFAQIVYHSDHLCCELIGLEIRRSTPDEIDMHIKYEKSEKEKEKQIIELEKQIREIKKSI